MRAPSQPANSSHYGRAGTQYYHAALYLIDRYEHHTRCIQPLEEGCQILLRRPQLSFRQRFSLQPQNAVMAPLVPQIHSYRQTVEIGAKLPPGCSSPALVAATFLRSSFSFSFPTSSASTSFVSRCTGPRDFARFDVSSLFFRELLCFFKVDLLSRFDCTFRVR